MEPCEKLLRASAAGSTLEVFSSQDQAQRLISSRYQPRQRTQATGLPELSLL